MKKMIKNAKNQGFKLNNHLPVLKNSRTFSYRMEKCQTVKVQKFYFFL